MILLQSKYLLNICPVYAFCLLLAIKVEESLFEFKVFNLSILWTANFYRKYAVFSVAIKVREIGKNEVFL